MLTLRFTIAGACAALLLAACSKPEAPATAEPQADATPPAMGETLRGPDTGEAGGADPTIVDPDHYTAELENDAVRVLRIHYGPGEESVMHYHPASVTVFLDDIDVEMTMGDGSTVEAATPAGTVLFNPAGEHQPKNRSGSAWEVVEVELKPRDRAMGESSGGPDPTVVDAKHYRTELENDQVRVLRITYGPGEQSVMHYHPDAVAVFLTDQDVEMTLPDGSTQVISAKARDVLAMPGGQHLPKNIGDSAFELVLVELK